MTGVWRPRAALVAIALLGAVLASCASPARTASAGDHRPLSTQPSGAAGATILTRFTPYSSAGALTVPVAGHATGRCWTGSIVAPVAGAYRCLVGNDIADPCFAPPRRSTPMTLACLPDPWSGARVVTLIDPLPVASPIGNAAHPWAVQLANGARCVASTGTVQSVDGVALNLLCPGSRAAGGLDTSSRTWRVRYGPKSGATLTAVDVSQAWRG